MPVNYVYTHFKPSDLPAHSGPEDLVDCLLLGRRRFANLNVSHLSDSEMRQLVLAAFDASLSQDEGRFPRFQAVAHWSCDATELFPLLAFSEPVPVTVESLRRLAPGFSHIDHAFRVRAHEGELLCDGIDSTERWLGILAPGRPEFWAVGGHTCGLRVRVYGPGHLLVSETALHFQLKAGKLADLVPIGHATQWYDWRHTLGEAIRAELDRRGGMDLDHLFGGPTAIDTMVGHILGRVLERAVSAQHGGTVVFLPKADLDKTVRFRWPRTSLSLRTLAADWWQSSALTTGGLSEDALRQYVLSRERLFHGIRSLAYLTQVDGCVVMSEDLDVLGCGGEILKSEGDSAGSPLVFSSIDSDDPWPDQTGNDLGGMRHRSAYRLCKSVPGALAFVVSQDGELTLLWSTPDRVYAVRGLTSDLFFG
jgi:hypothetical protein